MLAKARADDLLVPQVVYGYFPANGDGDDLVIWTDELRREEKVRFTYPRFREDQLQRFAWLFLIPISLLNILATGVLKVVF